MVYIKIKYNGVWSDTIPKLVSGEFGQTVYFQVFNDDGSEFDLTTCTVTVSAKYLNDFNQYMFEDISCTITSASDGEFNWSIVDGNLSDTGSFKFIITFEKAGFKEISNIGYLTVTS